MKTEEDLVYHLALEAQKQAVQRRRRRRARAPVALRPKRRPNPSPTAQWGDRIELRARRHLESAGIQVLHTQLHGRAGEIDLVCRDKDTLVFVEVRGRSSSTYGGAAASVNRRKQLRLIRTAQLWLPRLVRSHFPGRNPPCRFDVVCVERGRIQWLRHAFSMR